MSSRVEILLVEDNPADAELILMVLAETNLDAHVHVAHDGVDALDFLFRRNGYAELDPWQQPAVVLLDIMMPRLDGFEVLKQVKSHSETRDLPVVMFTSSKVERDVQRAYELGVNSYIQKPVDFDQLGKVLSAVAHYWVHMNERVVRERGGIKS